MSTAFHDSPVGAPAPTPKPVAGPPAPGKKTVPPSPVPAAVTQPIPKTGPPNPVLAKAGYTGNMQDFNDRVKDINSAYIFRFGKPPTPGIVLDLARSQTPLPELRKMIAWLPRNPQHAAAKNYVANAQKLEPLDTSQPSDKVDFLRQHGAVKDASPAEVGAAGFKQEVQQAGFTPAVPNWTAVTDLPRQGQDLVKGFAIGLPLMAYGEGKALTYDAIKQKSLDPALNYNKTVGKTLLDSFSQMVQDPRHNSLNWLLLAAGGAGALEKTGAVGGALLKGDLKAAGRLALSAPDAGTTTLHYGGEFTGKGAYVEGTGFEFQAQNAHNLLFRLGQSLVRDQRQLAADRRFKNGASLPAADQILGKSPFSWEKKVQREIARKQRADVIFGTQGVKDIEAAAGWSKSHNTAMAKLPAKARNGLTVGENAALMVESFGLTGSPAEKIAQVRGFYERQASLGLADPKQIDGVLASLKLAERALDKPSPRYQKALDAVRAGSDEATRLKIVEATLSPEAAARRAGAPARMIEGKVGSRREAVSEIRALRKNQEAGIGDSDLIEARIADLQEQKKTAPGDIGKMKAKLTAAEQAVGRNPEDAVSVAKRDALQAEFDRSVDAYKRQAGETPDNAFYVPLIGVERTPKSPKNMFRGPRVLNGMPNYTVRNQFPEVYHEFTGHYFRAGNMRIDTANLVGRNLGKTIRGTMILDSYQGYLKAATVNRKSEWDIPIRTPDTDKWPDDIKRVFNRTDQGELTTKDAAALSAQESSDLIRMVFPNENDPLLKGDKSVKWIDRRLLGADATVQPVPTGAVKFLERVNAPFRTITLYGRPAYIANLAGSIGMGLVYQGLLLPVNMMRAFRSDAIYGEEFTRLAHELVGAGKSNSYVDETLNSKLTRNVAHFWNVVTDRNTRTSAFIFFLKKKGLSDEEITKLASDVRKGDETARATMLDARDRANKAMVQFDNLTHVEREYLRHFIFVYPWTRGAVVWSLKTAMDRPLTTEALTQMGMDEYDKLDPFLAQMPEWFKKTGYIPLWWKDNGNPVMVNTSGISTPATFNALLHGAPKDLLPPGAETMIHALTGQDQFGNDYPNQSSWTSYGTNFLLAVEESVAQLPQAKSIGPVRSALQKIPYEDKFLRDPSTQSTGATLDANLDLSDRDSKRKAYMKAAHEASFTPGYWGGIGQFIGGGAFTPREANVPALVGKAWKGLSKDEKLDFTKKFALDVLALQGKFLGRPVPNDLKKFVAVPFEMDKYIASEQAKGNGQTDAETTQLALDFLHQRMYVNDEDYKKQTKLIEKASKAGLADPAWWTQHKADLISQFVDTKQSLSNWDSDVKAGWALTKPAVIKLRVDALKRDGILEGGLPSGLSHAALVAYGSKVAKFEQQYRERADEVANTSDPTERKLKEDALRIWTDERDKPIDGLPSVVRMNYAQDIDPAVRAKAIAQAVTSPWSSLARYQKQLLGQDGKGSDGWGHYKQLLDDALARRVPGDRESWAEARKAVAVYVDKNYAPGFLKDWQFSQLTLGQRMATLPPIQKSPQAATWNQILGTANKLAKAIQNDTYPAQQGKDAWHDYVAKVVLPWAKTQPGFQQELNKYGDDVLYKLLEK